MSDSDRPEISAFHELEMLVRHLGDELAAMRRRALVAEARVRDHDVKDARPGAQARRELADRCAELEHENAALKERVESATGTTRQMLDRVRFIRQQTQATAGSDR